MDIDMSLPWFRLYRELKDDPKIGQLTDAEFRCYIESLCWACERGEDGNMGLTMDNADWAFRRTVTVTLQSLLQKRLLEILPSGELTIPAWNKRQMKSDNSSERVKKHREKHDETLQKRSCNGLVTAQSRVEEIREEKKETKQETPAIAEKASISPIKEFESKWYDEYPKYHNGTKYLHGGAKDTQATKRMVAIMKPDALIAVAVRAWKNPGGFNSKQAATICGFASRLNDIQSELNAPPQTKFAKPKTAYDLSQPQFESGSDKPNWMPT